MNRAQHIRSRLHSWELTAICSAQCWGPPTKATSLSMMRRRQIIKLPPRVVPAETSGHYRPARNRRTSRDIRKQRNCLLTHQPDVV